MVGKRIVCFDLDGTIIDSTSAHVKAFNEAFKRNRLPAVRPDRLTAALGATAQEITRMFHGEVSEKKMERIVDDHWMFFREFFKEVKVIPGVLGALETLKKKYKLALISNNRSFEILEMLEDINFPTKLFDAVIGAEQVKHPKPEEDPILKAGDMLNAKVEYMVGDTIYDLQAGKDAGVKTVAVLSGVGNFDELWKEDPTIMVKSIALLPEFI